MTRLLPWLVLCAVLATGVVPTRARAADAPLRLAALYEVSSAIGGASSSFLWQPAAGMVGSCGPAKGPAGLGRFEAEIVAHGLTPTLGIVLEGAAGALGPDQVRVSVGEGEARVVLRPAVAPRSLAVRIHGGGDAAGLVRATQLIATQLQMELCLEHKVGRGWTGGDATSLRQAFLLDPADGDRPDRRAFGGERDPVPALLGPPDACLDPSAGVPEPGSAGGRGEGTLGLVPSDVWGASLRTCGPEERPGATALNPPASLRLRGTDEGEIPPAPAARVWQGLDVEIAAAAEDSATRVTVRQDGETLIADQLLFPGGVSGGLTDVLAAVPYRYPRFGAAESGPQRTVLLVPAWQLNEAIRRLAAGTPESPQPVAGPERQDGVAWILAHPERLWVQVPGEEGGNRWLDLMASARPGALGLRGWGYAVGLLAGRSPIALPTEGAPRADAALAAQRATPHALFLLAMGVLGVGLLRGLRRLPELWLPQPEERADYWPGAEPEEEPEPEGPEIAIGEGE